MGLHTDPDAQAYIDAIDPIHRPLFDRLHAVVEAAFPDAEVVFSYKMPTYKVGKKRLYAAVWTHGLSVYGWPEGAEPSYADRHPELLSGKGTLRITPEAASEITDAELTELATAALGD